MSINGTTAISDGSRGKTTRGVNVKPLLRCNKGGNGKHVLKKKTVQSNGHPVVTAVTENGSRNRSANMLGTVDRAIRERNIFTALSKMPVKFQTILFENGWIEKKPTHVIRNEPNALLSLHKNVERVKTVSKRYESGLLWTDAFTGGVNWSTLHPSVMVNRFPRDGYTRIKLCGRAMARRTEFDNCFPRAYPVTLKTITGPFVEDYSLTACVSLIRMFVDGNVKFQECGQVPISILHFALNKCNQYLTENTIDLLADEGTKWKVFFEHYYKIISNYQNFTTLPDDKVIIMMTESRRLLKDFSALRPQIIMDGYKNIWIIKRKQPSSHQPFMSNKIEDILKKCTGINGDDCIIQKYIETPLLYKNAKFNVQAWIVISTLDDCLTVWVYRTCCLQFYMHKFSLDAKPSEYVHYTDFQSNKFLNNLRVQTCNLKQLKERLHTMGVKRNGNSSIYSKIKSAVVTSVLAAEDNLNLRPNCFELFQVTFVLGSDLHPWLIDIKSDPCLVYPFYHAMSTITNGVTKNLAKILMDKNRALKTTIGMFDLINKRPIPSKYVVRAFVEKIVSEKRVKTKTKSLQQIYDSQQFHHWISDLVPTYIENVQVNEIDNSYYLTRKSDIHINAALTDYVELPVCVSVENNLCLIYLKDFISRLRSGSKIKVHEMDNFLHFLNEWKKRVRSAQEFYKELRVKKQSTMNKTTT